MRPGPPESHGLEVVKPSALASRLGRHFAKTGRLDPKFHRIFLNARRVRKVADYGLFEEVIASSANLTLEESQALVSEIERLLQP